MLRATNMHDDGDGQLGVEVRVIPPAEWPREGSALGPTWACSFLPGGFVIATRAFHDSDLLRGLADLLEVIVAN